MARTSQLSGSQAINEYPLRRRHPILMQSRGIDEDSLLVAEGGRVGLEVKSGPTWDRVTIS